MTEDEHIWRGREGASYVAIETLRSTAGVELPAEYLELLARSNGGEGDLMAEPGWFALWPAEDVVANNVGYNVGEFLPEYFAFGSNGGGEMFVLERARGRQSPVYSIPFVPMDAKDRMLVAPSFVSFVRLLAIRQETPAAKG